MSLRPPVATAPHEATSTKHKLPPQVLPPTSHGVPFRVRFEKKRSPPAQDLRSFLLAPSAPFERFGFSSQVDLARALVSRKGPPEYAGRALENVQSQLSHVLAGREPVPRHMARAIVAIWATRFEVAAGRGAAAGLLARYRSALETCINHHNRDLRNLRAGKGPKAGRSHARAVLVPQWLTFTEMEARLRKASEVYVDFATARSTGLANFVTDDRFLALMIESLKEEKCGFTFIFPAHRGRAEHVRILILNLYLKILDQLGGEDDRPAARIALELWMTRKSASLTLLLVPGLLSQDPLIVADPHLETADAFTWMLDDMTAEERSAWHVRMGSGVVKYDDRRTQGWCSNVFQSLQDAELRAERLTTTALENLRARVVGDTAKPAQGSSESLGSD